MGPLVRLSDVSVVREGKTILKRTSLTVMEGEHVAIVGPNGAGKSTLVKLMTGEIYPFRGQGSVTFRDGRPKSEQRTLRTELAVVSADAMNQLIADPTVRELIISGFFGTFGVLWSYEVESKHEERARELARQLNIENLYDRKLSTLSSGEARRAWIGRALAPDPKGLILDEPTAHLDASAMEQFRETLHKVAAGGVTLVLVTHHYEEITPLFQRIVVLREGEIVADGPRAELLESKRINKLLNPLSQAREVTQPHSPQEYLEAIKQAPVYDVAIKTPFEHAPMISQRLGNSVFLKREDRQAVFSFKLRGAYALMATLSKEDLEKGVIAASAGNHAQGVALAAKTLGAKATIVVPKTTPSVKTDAILFLGANLILYGDSYDEAHDFARKLAEQDNLTYVHPYDQPHVIAGQGTVGLEIHEQAGALDVVFVAVGGGGLISGVALALKQLRPGVKVIGVEPEDSDAMHRSLAAHQRIKLDRVGLLADGVAVKLVGEETFRIAKEWVDEVILVSNDQICGAVKEIFEDRRAVLEPSGALAFAGLKKYVEREKIKGQSLCAIACGANLNFDRLRYIAERAQVGERRETILAVKIKEKKGSFRAFCSALGHRNVTEFNYRFGDESEAVVFVGIATKNDEEHAQLVESLEARSYRVADLTGDELATTHLRHMVGGRAAAADLERLYHFDFPEREGALEKFLSTLGDRFNISLFHYRNHGSDVGRVLVGFQIPNDQREVFDTFRRDLGYPSSDVTDNVGLSLFLR